MFPSVRHPSRADSSASSCYLSAQEDLLGSPSRSQRIEYVSLTPLSTYCFSFLIISFRARFPAGVSLTSGTVLQSAALGTKSFWCRSSRARLFCAVFVAGSGVATPRVAPAFHNTSPAATLARPYFNFSSSTSRRGRHQPGNGDRVSLLAIATFWYDT